MPNVRRARQRSAGDVFVRGFISASVMAMISASARGEYAPAEEFIHSIAYSSPQQACAAMIKRYNAEYSNPLTRHSYRLNQSIKVSNFSKYGPGSERNRGEVLCKYSYTDVDYAGKTSTGSSEQIAGMWSLYCTGSAEGGVRLVQGADDVVRCSCDAGYVEKFNKCVPAENEASAKAEYKNSSEKSGVCSVGNPINPSTGAKHLTEVDYVGAATGVPLRFERRYNSLIDPGAQNVGLGWGWRHTFSRALTFDEADADHPRVRVVRPDGSMVVFTRLTDGSFSQDADVNDRLVAIRSGQTLTGYKLTLAESDEGVGVVELYDVEGRIQSLTTLGGWVQNFLWSTSSTDASVAPAAGYLIGVSDSTGRALGFRYNDAGQIVELKDPAGKLYSYGYDDQGNLSSITNPRSELRKYHYNEAIRIKNEEGNYGAEGESAHLLHALTGVTDENNVRFAEYRYQFDGRAIETTHALGADKHTVSYNENGSASVLDPLGQARNYEFSVAQGVTQPKDQDVPCSTGSPYKSVKSDENGNPEYRIDFNGNRVNYVFDKARNLETERTEGLNASGGRLTESRKTSTEWHATLRLPKRIAEPLKLTTFEYYDNGLLKSKTEQATLDADGFKGFSASLDTGIAARKSTFTYNGQGQLTQVDGPRTDVTDVAITEYQTVDDVSTPPKWRKGDLKTFKNAAGHVTTFLEFDQRGNILRQKDANDLVTVFEYDEIGRIKSQTVGALKTSYTYDKRGLLDTVSTPEGQVLTHKYDNAHRLTKVLDKDGNRIEYFELDAMGNRRDERVYNASSQLVRQQKRVYSKLNRLEQDIGAASPSTQITRYDYDLGGNRKQIKDPLGRITDMTFDALNRVKTTTQPEPDTGLPRPITTYGYNAQGQLTSVQDPRLLSTTYTVDGLGDTRGLASPDSGAQTFTYDGAGNVKTARDAIGQVTTYTYDELNRVKEVLLHEGTKHQYQYDTGANAKGRLNQITEINASGATVTALKVTYDVQGRVATMSREIASKAFTVKYAYDTSGRLETLTYPSGRLVKYGYDTSGRVSQITTQAAGGTSMVTVVSSVKYHPFGAVSQFTHGNGQTHSRPQNLDGRSSGYSLGASTFQVDYDDAGQVKAIRDVGNVLNTNTYGWDGLGRLKSAALPSATHGYQYDGVGNRTKHTVGSSQTIYTYPATSHRIADVGGLSWTHDANGSVKSTPARQLQYDSRGRLKGAWPGDTSYVVDAQGVRVRKTNAQGDVVFVQDEGGTLLSESTAAGVTLKEYIYLGTLPVAVVAQ